MITANEAREAMGFAQKNTTLVRENERLERENKLLRCVLYALVRRWFKAGLPAPNIQGEELCLEMGERERSNFRLIDNDTFCTLVRR